MKTALLFLALAAHAFAQGKQAPPAGVPGWLRVAFSLTPKGGQGAVGGAELEGRTIANMEARTVVIQNLKINTARFPSLPGAEAAKQFGDEFAARLRDLPVGQWQGPVESGYSPLHQK